jgi:hypothetical protein
MDENEIQYRFNKNIAYMLYENDEHVREMLRRENETFLRQLKLLDLEIDDVNAN